MDVSAALRRIKRQFGDEYNVVINDQDIYDWIHDSELDIIRATSDNDLTIPVSITNFPLQVPDKVSIKRLSISGKALTNVALSQLDLAGSYTSSKGGASYWYYQGGMAYLWPTPESTDKTIIDVTYARTPSQMTVVAPYLQFTMSPAVLQVGQVLSDNDWKLATSVNVAMEVALDTLTKDYMILNCGTDPAVPANNHFSIQFKTVSPKSLYFTVSNGTTTSIHTLDMVKPFVPGEVFKFRITFDGATDTSFLYRINQFTGQEVLQDTETHSTVFNKQVASAADLYIGNKDLITVPVVAPIMRVYSVELRNSYDLDSTRPPIAFLFNGMDDLGDLFAATASFITSSAHTMTTTGGIVTVAQNEFTVPEVYHEDVVKYCLARAHTKNQNFRAAESEMEQYDRRVSTRRNEAQAPETALYKIPDPADYEDYVQ